MGYRKQTTVKKASVQTKPQPSPNESARNSAPSAADASFNRVLRYIAAGNYQLAFDSLRDAGRNLQMRNTRGVCLLRMGRFSEAVNLLRELVLKPGCTWVCPELPTEYKANFATALLLNGNTSGCVEILSEIGDESHPDVQRLRAAIRRWEPTLSLWQRLNWRFGKIAPDNKPVEIDFEPGSFDFEVVRTNNSDPAQPVPPLGTAA